MSVRCGCRSNDSATMIGHIADHYEWPHANSP